MEQKSSRKRQFFEDEDSSIQSMQKRVRFPKGKKVKPGNEVVDRVKDDDDDLSDLKNPRLAATERASRRNQMTFELCSEENRGIVNDISRAEVTYEGNENFVDDGIHIEPFNLDKEREEGYFDAEGNFVEYINENEIKDAWLDSLEVDQRLVGTAVNHNKDVDDEEDSLDLSSAELGVIKRRIANVLEPGETVTQALRRLKGTSNNKKEKMSAETKRVFDQLTDDAMKLMEENGELNVYNENRETFEREAEQYERLAQLRGEGSALSFGPGNSDSNAGNYLFSDISDPGSASASMLLSDFTNGNSTANATGTGTVHDSDDAYDMFADDDEGAIAKPSTDGLNTVSGPNSIAISQPSSDALNAATDSGSLQNDYVYDESSGYYYSISLGYYYDPSSGLYCSAASGQWYSYNEETGAYEEVNEAASATN